MLLDRLLAACLAVLAGAAAIYVAVRLLEAVAPALLIIAAIVGGLTIVSFVGRLLWRRIESRRW
ncbi:MAG: hypothetical protein QM572_07295 [Nocardioides sp.]|uniref:hypothetical protein n=1 Tax=Nocardioides sp. TaxID=35761 RepID=UPI0039E6E657